MGKRERLWKEFKKKSVVSPETADFIQDAFSGGLERKERARLGNGCLFSATNSDIEERVVLDRKTFDKIFREKG